MASEQGPELTAPGNIWLQSMANTRGSYAALLSKVPATEVALLDAAEEGIAAHGDVLSGLRAGQHHHELCAQADLCFSFKFLFVNLEAHTCSVREL